VNDLLLWRALGGPEPLPDELVPLLEELAARPAAARMPFIGRLLRAARDERPGVRVAALAGLAGHDGAEAIRAVVRGLDDAEPGVAATAVESLRATSAADAWRIVHALFHPDPEIRKAAVAGDLPAAAGRLLPHLLRDEAVVEDVLPLLAEAETLPGFALRALLDQFAAGRLATTAAADLVSRIATPELLRQIAAGGLHDAAGAGRWSPERVRGLLESLGSEPTRPAAPFIPAADRLPELIAVLGAASPEPAAPGLAAGKGIDRLVCGLSEADQVIRGGVAVAAVARLLAAPAASPSIEPGDDPPLVRLLVAAWPPAALWRWLDLGLRRTATETFFKIPENRLNSRPYGHLGSDWLKAIAASDLLRDAPDATLDLRVLAAVARLVGLDALEQVTAHFRGADLVAGLREPRAAAFLSLPGSSAERLRLVARSMGTDRSLWPMRLAHLVPAFDRELVPLLADFTPAETLQLLARMQRLAPALEIKDPRGRRLEGVAAELGRRLAGAPLADASCVRAVGTGPQPGAFVLETTLAVQHAPVGHLPPTTCGELLEEFVRQWRDGPRAPPCDAFLRRVFLAVIDALSDATAARRLESFDADNLRFLLFEQFADDVIPSRLDAALRAVLADRERPPAPTLAAALTSAGGNIVGGLNRVWTALLGRREPEAEAPPKPSATPAPAGAAIHTLTVVERCRLIDAPPVQLGGLLRPWVNQPTRTLAECLARRPAPQPRGADAAAAILLCHDPLPAIDAALATFLPACPSVICQRLDADLAARRPGHEPLTLHLHAWLWRWERHVEQGLAILADTNRSLAAVAVAAHGLACRPLAIRLLEFVRAVLDRCGFRDRDAFHLHATKDLADAIVSALASPAGPAAAGVLIAWSNRDPRSVILAQARLGVVAMLPDLPLEVREVLEPWVSSRGIEQHSAAVPPTLRAEFEACLARGTPADIDRAVWCVLAETGAPWFMPPDWERLVAAGLDDRILARRLAVARQPHAYIIALETLLTEPAVEPDDVAAVTAFLEEGDGRLAELRVAAAEFLCGQGSPAGRFLLVANEMAEKPRTPRLFVGLDAEAVADAVRSAVAGGGVRESVLAELLLEPAVADDARVAGLQVLLVEGGSDTVRDRILPALAGSRSRLASDRLRRVAECFAWGIRRGLELTGRLFAVQMIGGDDLGYTRLHEPRVFVNPLPILRGERHAEDIVRGLVIHEVGHHVYHADADNLQAAEQARKGHFFNILNLVMDEHLERNLRAIDPALGDPLKRLAAYGFQHAPRQFFVPALMDLLADRAFAALSQVRLAVARKPGHVVVQAGRVLRQLEQQGSSFARFARGLRMGLGGRVTDARVAEAMALFGPGFRHSSGSRLLEIARELRRIFGDEIRLLELLGGLDTPVEGMPGDPVRVGEGLTDREIQQEVERVLEPPSRAGSTGRPIPGGRLVINVAGDEDFSRITTVARVPFDPARSAHYRRRVARPAACLRRFFERLGFAHTLDRQRLQGRLLDRSRLLALAVRGEPRVMVSRRLVPKSDLFLGVAVDCSGSMASDDNIEKARLFAELLAESVRGCRGIDLAVCGFNDETIFDAGSAERCAAHSLDEGGGNNDAAGLWHLAEVALASRRRAKLLVMISDGLPTECSVAALRKLVQVLSHRYGMCCAQVAVRPLEEECFPIHVRLDEDDLAGAVAAFGRTVVRLVERAVRTGA